MKYIIISLLLFFISCDFSEKSSQEEIAHLYVDILVVEETYKTDLDSMKIALDSLYKFHKINENEYIIELEKYRYDKETWKEFFKLAETYLDTLKAVEKRVVLKK